MDNLRAGLKVRIARWNHNPDFWDDDGEMMKLARGRKIYTVTERNESDQYKLEGVIWNWRRKDLIIVEQDSDDPNLAFIIKRISQ
jgi:hypothetical protein